MKRKPIVSVGTMVIIGAVGLLILLVGLNGGSTIVTENETVEIATSTEPAIPAEWLEKAEQAKAKVLRQLELEKENEEIESQIKALEARQAEIEKELGF